VPTSVVLRTQATGETAGLMKALVSENDDRILGFTMIGAEAGEVMAVVQAAVLGGLPHTSLRDAIPTHPAMTEGPRPPFSNVPPLTSQQVTPEHALLSA